MRGQENLPSNPCTLIQSHSAQPGCLGPFSFQQPRGRIDWRAVQGVDVDVLARSTDIDALERVLDVVAFGDIEAEDARNLTPLNFIKLFRLAQLTVEYLLFVQDRLAADNCALKGEVGKLHGSTEVLQLKVKEQREEMAASRRELKGVKRAMRTLEAVALAQRQQPALPQQPEVQVVERVVEAVGPVTQYKLERMEGEVRELTAEREAMNREMLSLKDALAAALVGRAAAPSSPSRDAALAAAVEAARREEREIAEVRIQAAVEKERRTHLRDSKSKLSVVADTEESRALREKLAESLRRQRELEKQKDLLELELVHAMGSPMRGASPRAQVRHLKAELQAAQAEIRSLQDALRMEQQRGRPHSPRRSSHLHASGVGSMLEDASEASDARLEQLQSEVDTLNAELDRVLSEKAELHKEAHQLRRELRDAQQQLDQLQRHSASADWRAAELDRLDEEVATLREKNKELHTENAALRRTASTANAANEGNQHHAQQVDSPSKSHPIPTGSPMIKAQRISSQREKQRGEDAAEKAGLGSPIEGLAEGAGSGDKSSSSPQARPQPSAKHSPSRTALLRESRSQCSSPEARAQKQQQQQQQQPRSWQQRFQEEMSCTLSGHERPGVVSRFPHSRQSMLNMRRELMGELNAEVERELASYGIRPGAQRLTDEEFEAAMEELAARREEARAHLSSQDQLRLDYMRSTITRHVDKVARSLAEETAEEHAPNETVVLSPPRPLKSIRTGNEGKAALPSSKPKGLELAVTDAADPATDAFYSPLRSGASQLSFKSDGSGGSPLLGSPHSMRSAGPMVPDEDGTPRSPWAITHDRVFNSLDVGGSESPLGRGVHRSQLLLRPGAGSSPGPGYSLSPKSPKSPLGPQGSGSKGSKGGLRAPVHSSPGSPSAQRLPRRVARSGAGADEEGAASPGAASLAARSQGQGQGSPARRRLVQVQGSALPGASSRYPLDADVDSPVASPSRRQREAGGGGLAGAGAGALHDSRDLSTDDADSVRPAASRAARTSRAKKLL